jgi:xanthine dehydrogenase YagR molybdenum-binding subunit
MTDTGNRILGAPAGRVGAPAGRVGAPAGRVDGPLKVTGAASYPSDVTLPGLAHAALVSATIAAGTITRIGTARAQAAPGVLAVITHANARPWPRRR